jgi:hypothetical protein
MGTLEVPPWVRVDVGSAEVLGIAWPNWRFRRRPGRARSFIQRGGLQSGDELRVSVPLSRSESILVGAR